jgi:hypothetical protein
LSEPRRGAVYTRKNVSKVYLGDAHFDNFGPGAGNFGSSSLEDCSFGSRPADVGPGSWGFGAGPAGSGFGAQASPGTSQAAVNFFTDQVSRFGADPEILVERDDWQVVLGIFMMKAGAPNPQAYSTRRTFSDERMNTTMSRRGFKFGAKRPDTRDPPPERAGMAENPKDRSNKVLRCFACNSR